MPSQERFDGMNVEDLHLRLKEGTTPEIRFRALVGLCALQEGEVAFPVLVDCLTDHDASIVAYACKQLARRASVLTEEQVSGLKGQLETCLEHADPDVCFEAARAWIQLPYESARVHTLLQGLLNDPETQPLILGAVLKTLAKAQDSAEHLSSAIQKLSGHEKEDLREAAAEAIGLLGAKGREFTAILIELLDDEDPFVRERAAHSLSLLGAATPEVIAALEAATEDEDEGCAEEAKKSLEQLRHDGVQG